MSTNKTTRNVRSLLIVTGLMVLPSSGFAAEKCDPNYASPCIPVAADVDCLGGEGDGPAFTKQEGPFEIDLVGADIYDLDRDGDGIACEPPPTAQ